MLFDVTVTDIELFIFILFYFRTPSSHNGAYEVRDECYKRVRCRIDTI